MPKPADKAERERLLPVLWALFVFKIDREWPQKYSALGINRASTGLQELAAAIQRDMQQVLRKDLRVPLEQYLKNDNYPNSIAAKELAHFTRYLGFPSWIAFQAACDADQLPPIGSVNNPKKPRKGDDPWFYIGPILLFLMYCP